MPLTPETKAALVESILDHYDRTLTTYQALREDLQKSVPTRLLDAGLKYFRVEARVKERDSLKAKLIKDPTRPVDDVVGVRVMVFFRSDIPWVEQVLWKMLVLDEGSYVDKADLLTDDGFGYRSVQFVGSTKPRGWDSVVTFRDTLAPNGHIKVKVEVQVRTMLEHAWAEVEHDVRYKPNAEKPSQEINRTFAVTAALLEQADTNLDEIRDDIELDRPTAIPSRTAQLSGWDAQRFIQADRDSLALDLQIASSLDLKVGHVLMSAREVTRAASLAGWTTYSQMHEGVRSHGRLGLRLATASADTAHGIVMIDYEQAEPPRAFKGVGLYWVALAVALGIQDLDPFEDYTIIGIPDGRLAEFKIVAEYLIAHPDTPALTVRDLYRSKAAPAGTTRSNQFFPVML
ncbi:hypothetical protein KIV56_17060 [Cryobacterium breve]|uniref:RelA/SpoT domain-containing protein n=1 Tax=Cryobacterium breve TaxID=1259258 RepID=A0ABY7NBI7_9MICO|nr:hypothetical protein [Cryobacterium breve]WBM79856.1 hypothetical protein KIV56_17060 [Cryobacterium breve]